MGFHGASGEDGLLHKSRRDGFKALLWLSSRFWLVRIVKQLRPPNISGCPTPLFLLCLFLQSHGSVDFRFHDRRLSGSSHITSRIKRDSILAWVLVNVFTNRAMVDWTSRREERRLVTFRRRPVGSHLTSPHVHAAVNVERSPVGLQLRVPPSFLLCPPPTPFLHRVQLPGRRPD